MTLDVCVVHVTASGLLSIHILCNEYSTLLQLI